MMNPPAGLYDGPATGMVRLYRLACSGILSS